MKRLKSFRRWMSETCLPCPPSHLDNNESYVFSFYEDIVQVNNRHFVSVAAVLCLLCFCVIWIDSGWVGGAAWGAKECSPYLPRLKRRQP